MPDTSSSLLFNGSSRIEDRSSPNLVPSQKVSHVEGGSIPVANVFYLCCKALMISIWDSQQRCAHTWHISSRHLLLLELIVLDVRKVDC
jgi:hypothetical protein